jgi:hypothetical protein
MMKEELYNRWQLINFCGGKFVKNNAYFIMDFVLPKAIQSKVINKKD